MCKRRPLIFFFGPKFESAVKDRARKQGALAFAHYFYDSGYGPCFVKKGSSKLEQVSECSAELIFKDSIKLASASSSLTIKISCLLCIKIFNYEVINYCLPLYKKESIISLLSFYKFTIKILHLFIMDLLIY